MAAMKVRVLSNVEEPEMSEAERQMRNLDAFLEELEAHAPEPTPSDAPFPVEFLRAMMEFDEG
jgi:hypothetical protein